jgi:hypothetical protein
MDEKPSMRVLVCGGRDFKDHLLLWRVLDTLHAEAPFGCVIHGCARGADTFAGQWGSDKRIPVYRFHPDWSKGLIGGRLRNARMLEKGKPDLVIGFPGNKGTKHMMRIALAANVRVLKVKADGTVIPWVKRLDIEEAIDFGGSGGDGNPSP